MDNSYFNAIAGAVTGDEQFAPEIASSRYPYMQWVEAQQHQAYPTGGFFIPVEQPQLVGVTWPTRPVNLAIGGGIWGVPMNPIQVQVLAMRTDWGVDGLPGERGTVIFGERALADSIVARMGGRARSKFRVLTLVRGLEDLGPIMLTTAGMKGVFLSKELTDFFNRAWRPFSDAAQKQIGKPAPMFALYATIAAGQRRAASKDPSKAAQVTPPVWVEPEGGDISPLLVPVERVKQAAELWGEAKEWETAAYQVAGRAATYLSSVGGHEAQQPAQWGQQPTQQSAQWGQQPTQQPRAQQPPWNGPARHGGAVTAAQPAPFRPNDDPEW